jgi:hypothetical protein
MSRHDERESLISLIAGKYFEHKEGSYSTAVEAADVLIDAGWVGPDHLALIGKERGELKQMVETFKAERNDALQKLADANHLIRAFVTPYSS